MQGRKKIAVYSGHTEVVGGDVKYIVDLLNQLSLEKYEITVFTDENCVFMDWAKHWLKRPLKPVYLPTMPYLFRENLFESTARTLSRRLPVLGQVLEKPLKGQPLLKYLNFAYKILSLYHLRLKINNFFVFHRLFSKEKFDVFWFNNGGYPGKEAGQIACLVARLHRVPNIIMTFHNVPVNRNFFKPTDRLYDFLLAKILSRTIAVSKVLKEELIARRGFQPEKIEVLYCGLEDAPPVTASEKAEKRKELSLPVDAKLLLITGNLDERRKGHEELFEALKLVLKQFPETILLVVGSGTKERTQQLNDLARELGILNNVRFLGQRYDIHILNSIVDLPLVPSYGSEATPYTIKEASRAAKPVITSTAGGCAEAVLDGKTGLLFKTCDSTDLARQVIALLGNPGLRDQLGIEGRKFFEGMFLLSSQVKSYDEILSQ